VPLSPESCVKDCAEKKVDKPTCRQLCQVQQGPCSYWQEVVEKAKKTKDNIGDAASSSSVVYHSSRTSLSRQKRQTSLTIEKRQTSLTLEKSQASLTLEKSQASTSPQNSKTLLSFQKSQKSFNPQNSETTLSPQKLSQTSLSPQKLSQTSLSREQRWSEAQVLLPPDETGPSTIVLTDPAKKKKKFVSLIPFAIPEPVMTTPPTSDPFHIIPYSSEQLYLRSEEKLAQCSQLTCLTDDAKKATLCFQQVKNEANYSLLQDGDGKANTLFVV